MSYSLSELSQVAGALLKAYGQKPIWAFQAPMGAGKTTLIAAICKEMGVELIKPPTDTVKKSGFLKEEYYANDATHANAKYGLLVLNQLTDMLNDNE